MAFKIPLLLVFSVLTVLLLEASGNSEPCACRTAYTKRGCYHDPGSHGNHDKRPLKNLLLNWRDKIDWSDGWNDHLKNMACTCAALAKKKGYRYFGLQYYGECWSGPHSSTLFDSASSEKCWGHRPDYANCVDDSPTECIGQGHYNYIYEVLPEVPEGCTGGGSSMTKSSLPPKITTTTTTEKPTTLDPCLSRPCRHGGECLTLENNSNYLCSCPSDFTGRNCQIPKGRK